MLVFLDLLYQAIGVTEALENSIEIFDVKHYDQLEWAKCVGVG